MGVSIPEPLRLTKRASPAIYLPALSLFIIVSPFILRQIIADHSDLDLPWPGRQVIPSILFLRGYLETDFFSGSTNSSVYAISAKILSAILPANTDQMLAAFDTLSILLKYTVLWLAVILLVRFCCYFWISNQLIVKKQLTEIRLIFYIYFSFLVGAVADRFIDARFLLLLRPAHVADWDFPYSSLNPSGISCLLILLALIPCYSGQRLEAPKAKNNVGLSAAIVLAFFAASIIHPVVPLFGLGLFLVSWLLFMRTEGILNRWLRLFLAGSCAWATAAVCIKIMFPQGAINAAEFYKIYVEQRHAHHYLPSDYLKASFKPLVLNLGILLVTMLLSIRYQRLRPARTLAVASLVVLVAIHGTQYLFVEYLHLSSFVILGITRISGLYEFLYACVIATLFLFVLERFRRRKKAVAHLAFSTPRHVDRVLSFTAWPGSLALAIAIALAAGTHYKMVYASIPNSNERMLQNEFDRNSIPYPRQIIFDDSIWRKNAFNALREVGGFDVYGDYYFPFSMGEIIEWNNRMLAKESFLDCLKRENTLSSCHFPDPGHKPLYFVSLQAYEGMTPTFKADINGTAAYIYLL